MRGPWLSGAVGHPATLERMAALLRNSGAGPVVVLSSVWLAELMAAVVPVLLVVEPEALRSARRAARKATRAGRELSVLVASEELPLRPAAIGAVLVEALVNLETTDAAEYVADLVTWLRPGGVLVSLDGVKEPEGQAALAGWFLGAGLVGIGQERPREGAVVTVGEAPAPAILAAIMSGVAGAEASPPGVTA